VHLLHLDSQHRTGAAAHDHGLATVPSLASRVTTTGVPSAASFGPITTLAVVTTLATIVAIIALVAPLAMPTPLVLLPVRHHSHPQGPIALVSNS
jgi:hypothetical protein